MSGSNSLPPLREKPVVFLDTETSGLLKHPYAEILEIAVVALDGTVLLDTKVRPVLLEQALFHDPEGTEAALKVNGYDADIWKDAPRFEELVEVIEKIFKYKVIVGHNPNFDRTFVLRGLEHAGIKDAHRWLERHVVDTTTLAWEHLVPCGLNQLRFGEVCRFLGVALDREHRHGALADAQACRAVYLTLLRATEEQRLTWRERAKSLPQTS